MDASTAIHQKIRVKEIPLWSIVITGATLLFGAGKFYGQQNDLILDIDKLRSEYQAEIKEIEDSINGVGRQGYELKAGILEIKAQMQGMRDTLGRLETQTSPRSSSSDKEAP